MFSPMPVRPTSVRPMCQTGVNQTFVCQPDDAQPNDGLLNDTSHRWSLALLFVLLALLFLSIYIFDHPFRNPACVSSSDFERVVQRAARLPGLSSHEVCD